jgi:hypothetical protein
VQDEEAPRTADTSQNDRRDFHRQAPQLCPKGISVAVVGTLEQSSSSAEGYFRNPARFSGLISATICFTSSGADRRQSSAENRQQGIFLSYIDPLLETPPSTGCNYPEPSPFYRFGHSPRSKAVLTERTRPLLVQHFHRRESVRAQTRLDLGVCKQLGVGANVNRGFKWKCV